MRALAVVVALWFLVGIRPVANAEVCHAGKFGIVKETIGCVLSNPKCLVHKANIGEQYILPRLNTIKTKGVFAIYRRRFCDINRINWNYALDKG
jgi:hypothetical protein